MRVSVFHAPALAYHFYLSTAGAKDPHVAERDAIEKGLSGAVSEALKGPIRP